MRIAYSIVNFVATLNYVIGMQNKGLPAYPNLVAVVDSSSSITLQSYNRAIQYLVENIECEAPRDVCVISFATEATLAIQCSSDMSSVKKSLGLMKYNIQFDNNTKTDIAAALTLTFNTMLGLAAKNTMVLLISDGKTNDPGDVEMAKSKAIVAAKKVRSSALDFACMELGAPESKFLNKLCTKNKVFRLGATLQPELCKLPPSKAPTKMPTYAPTIVNYADLLLIVDYSSSIKKSSLELVKSFISQNIQCEKTRNVCVVIFATQATLLIKCTSDLPSVNNTLAALTPYTEDSKQSGTNIASAFRLASKVLTTNSLTKAAVVFFSDGKATIPGDIDKASFKAIRASRKVKAEALFFSCVGVEDDANMNFLNKVCDAESVSHINAASKPSLCSRV